MAKNGFQYTIDDLINLKGILVEIKYQYEPMKYVLIRGRITNVDFETKVLNLPFAFGFSITQISKDELIRHSIKIPSKIRISDAEHIQRIDMKNQLENHGINHAGSLCLKNGDIVNYGSIRVEDNNFIHYTGKGLREMFPSQATEESLQLQKLSEADHIEAGRIAITPISDIDSIID